MPWAWRTWANANILHTLIKIHFRCVYYTLKYHHSLLLKTFLKYINRSSSEDTKAAYMGYEDCLVLHVFTTDVNASLPGSRGQQIVCLKPFCFLQVVFPHFFRKMGGRLNQLVHRRYSVRGSNTQAIISLTLMLNFHMGASAKFIE